MITFQYSTVTPIYTLQLPNPQLGNGLEINRPQVVKQTMAGTYKIYKTGDISKTVTYEFRTLNQTYIDNFITFYENTKGKILKITEQDSDYYTGVVFDDQITITTIKDLCSYDLSLVIERS